MRAEVSIAALVFIQRESDGKILGVSRKENHDDWGMPGGKAENDEYPVQTAIRECLEEAGVEVTVPNLVEIFRGPARTPGRIAIVFRAEDWAKTAEPGPGEGKVDWITWADLKRGSFRDFYTVFEQVVRRHEEHVRSLVPLVARIVYEERPHHEVENDCVEALGLDISDAIRVVCYALLAGVIEHVEERPGNVRLGKMVPP